MQQILGFATLGLLGFDILCIDISLAINYWILLDDAVRRTYEGLWKKCTEVKSRSTDAECVDIEATDDIKAVRAMLFLGLFLVCGAIACVVLKLFVLKAKKELLYGAAGLLALAGLFLMVGFAVYRAEIFEPFEDIDYTLHAGFAFCIIAWLLTWAGAGTSAAMVFMKE